MVQHDYYCGICNAVYPITCSIREMPNAPYCCGQKTYKDYSAIQVQKFTPYVDYEIAADPVEFNTPKQRDEYLARNNLTMDSARYLRRTEPPAVVESVKLDDVKKEISEGNRGEPVELLEGAIADVSKRSNG